MRVLAATLLLASVARAAAQEPGPIVRARVEPAGGVMVGEPARVVVDVLTPTWFLSPPQFPTLDVPGALVVFEERGINLNESIGGTSYSGLQRDYLVYPMREGRLEIPSFEVTVVYAIDAKPSTPTPLATQPLSLEAAVPAAARGLDSFVSASRLRLRQTVEPRPKGLAVGEALRRTVTIEAEGAFGMMLPPLPVPAIAGLSAYPDPPHVEDRGGERGEARVARRVESVAYRLEREGDYELPAIEVAWWDVGAKQMRRARLAAVAFSVAPAPARADEIPLPAETEAVAPAQPAQPPARWSHLVVWIGLGAIALAFVARVFRPLARRVFRARARLAEARRRSQDSEPAWFGRVRRAAARGDAAATYRALLGWAQRLGPTGTLGAFLAQADDSELAEEVGSPRRNALRPRARRRQDRDPARPPPGGGAAPCPAGSGRDPRRPRPPQPDHKELAVNGRTETEENMRKTRRPFSAPLAALAVLALGLMLCAPAGAQAQPQAAKKPNILVIFGDDIGVWNISAYHRGMMGGRTPNIDRLAKEGALFTDYYGQQSCTAGRAAFILGQTPFRTGLLKVGMPGAKQGIQAKDPTIAELLKPLGYATAQVGKNHLGDRNEFLPTVHGFDEFFGNLYHLNAEEEPEDPDYPKNPEFRKNFGPRGLLDCKAMDIDDPTWTALGKVGKQIKDTGPMTRKRMETAEEELPPARSTSSTASVKAGKPFFLWHNTTRMHVWTRLSPRWTDKSGYGLYADGMMELDDVVGRLLKKLDDLGIADNTIVVFTTDNGAEIFSWPDGGNTPFHGEKGTTWEGGMRVPASSVGPASSSPAPSTTRSWRTRTGCPRCSRPRAIPT